jgi:thiamine transport system substrate-binding protein
VALLTVLALLAGACGDRIEGDAPQEDVPGKVTLVTNDAFADVSYLLDPFTAETGIEYEVIAGGDAGSMSNQAILTKGRPLGDVLYGFDNTFLSRLLAEDLFIPYQSPNAANIPDEFRLDDQWRVTPVDFGDVCVNYDKEALAADGLVPPASLDDLRRPEYASRLVVQNPATSSPGLAFMLATIAEYGENGWLGFWRDLADNGVEVTAGWSEAYFTSWTLYGGQQPLVVSYASSPPAEVVFADPMPEVAPSGVMEAGCFRQIEFIGILGGTDNEAGARALIDWWLTDSMQAELPLNYFVYPVNPSVALPEAFLEHTAVPEDPHTLPPDEITANRDRWIEEWTSVVLR